MARKQKQDTGAAAAGPPSVEDCLKTMDSKSKTDKSPGLSMLTAAQSAGEWSWIDFIDPRNRVPALVMEYLWGSRGLLVNRLLKIEAEEGVGKTSFLMALYGMAQMTSNALCLHLESEGAIAPPDFLASFGCDPHRLYLPKLDKIAIDCCFNKIDEVSQGYHVEAEKRKFRMPIVAGVDSISAFGASQNMEDDATSLDTGQGGLGLHSRFLSQWFRDRWPVVSQRDLLLVAITQLREKISTQAGFPGAPRVKPGEKTTIAARPLNYHASYRLELRSSPLKDKDFTQYGETVTFIVRKNKLSPKEKKVALPLVWNAGFQFHYAAMQLLADLGPIPLRSGRTFTLVRSGQYAKIPLLAEKNSSCPAGNEDAALEFMSGLYNHTEMLTELREALRVRGHGFQFETNYMPSPIELRDIEQTEDEAASDLVSDA